MDQLREHSITYRIAVGPQQGRKVFTLQTLPDERDADDTPAVGNVAGLLRASCPPPFGPACLAKSAESSCLTRVATRNGSDRASARLRTGIGGKTSKKRGPSGQCALI